MSDVLGDMRRRLPIRVESPCQEDWSAMPRRGEGRSCARCEKTVVDLSRVTRRRAEAIFEAHGGRLCGRIRANERGEAIFASEPLRTGILPVAMASLLAACSAETPEPAPNEPIAVLEPTTFGAATTASFGGSLATGVMMPLGPTPRPLATSASTVPVATIEDEPVTPTRDQRALTRRKQQERYLRAHPPIVHDMMGVMIGPDF